MHTENMSSTLYHFTGGRVMNNCDIAAEDKDEECYAKLRFVLTSGYLAIQWSESLWPLDTRSDCSGIFRSSATTKFPNSRSACS